MEFIKVPCILVATVGVHKSFTAPNVSSKGEGLPMDDPLEWSMMMMRRHMWFLKGVYWAVGIAETATIWAGTWPLVPGSGQILSKLKFQADVNDLRLTPLSVIGVGLIGLGTLLRMRCYQVMKAFFTFDVSIRKDHKLVTTGPYGVVRHPSYSGMLMVYVGMACWYGSRGSWLRQSGILETGGGVVFFGMFGAMMGSVMVGLLRRMSVEDGVLRKQFGEVWIKYANNVPYCLIPWIY